MSVQKENQVKVDSDGDELQDMMDVDFPGGGSSEEDQDVDGDEDEGGLLNPSHRLN